MLQRTQGKAHTAFGQEYEANECCPVCLKKCALYLLRNCCPLLKLSQRSQINDSTKNRFCRSCFSNVVSAEIVLAQLVLAMFDFANFVAASFVWYFLLLHIYFCKLCFGEVCLRKFGLADWVLANRVSAHVVVLPFVFADSILACFVLHMCCFSTVSTNAVTNQKKCAFVLNLCFSNACFWAILVSQSLF